MGVVGTFYDLDGSVEEFSTVWAVANRGICATVIQIVTRFRFHWLTYEKSSFSLHSERKTLTLAVEIQSGTRNAKRETRNAERETRNADGVLTLLLFCPV